jgi:hypothetical protein
MERTNRKLNLALRLGHSFRKEDLLWNQPYGEQQPDATAQADRPKSGARPQAAVRLKIDRRAETAFQEPPKPA